ncbi:hypothetical protein BRADI_4g13682v3 [Brachypodium distachyon]|uniref:F-box domain-containing protein n=1 Tax=Brachypodium distachyon TaxID=15368 RepID=A0A0Q3L582_BRADI|nr:hypothetical protein BRADI_4g13682v3 [Brachypodium distachyon]PNT63275.1 hypothetical protein BRADI_4g13682v3 [Brachypodium distachyon]
MLQGNGGQEPPGDSGSGGDGKGAARDRISDLPDDLCHRVLSFLKAWEVVRMSLLSRRWRHMWASAPCLDIRHPCACNARADQRRYEAFVNNLLLRRSPDVPLDTLHLSWTHSGAVDTWTVYAVRHHARAIELSGTGHYPRPEPEYTSFLFGNFKILKLTHVKMYSELLAQLCSRCTSLEELELKNSSIHGVTIRSGSLRRLTMVNCFTPNSLLVDAPGLVLLRCIRPYSVVPEIRNSGSLVTATIMLDDSCLLHRCDHEWPPIEDDGDDDDVFFAYADGSDAENPDDSESDDDGSAGSDAENPDNSESDDDGSAGSHAEDADGSESGDDGSAGSHAEDPNDSESDDDGSAGSHAITVFGGSGILRSLFNVRTMELLAHRGEVLLRSQLRNCPVFKNLKTLSLGEWCIGPDFDALSTILEHSPNLEKLYLHLDEDHNSRGEISPSGRPFTCNHLKLLKITHFKDDTITRKLVEFVCQNGNGGAGSEEMRKAQDEAAESSGKSVRESQSPE